MSDEPQTSGDTLLSADVEESQKTTTDGTTKRASQLVESPQPLYLPLVEAQIIRLVELKPGDQNDPIILRLFVAELEHAPEYEAISYVWGDPKNTLPVLCNGRRLDITVNLRAAFIRVRLTDRPRILWADAICINQRNVIERSHHVSFMGSIYGNAKKVLVILGEDPDGDAEDVASLVEENANLVSKYDLITDMPILAANDPVYDDPRWKAVAKVAKHVWFTRAWVLQETGLAKDPRVLYGKIEFSYRDLMRLAVWVMRCAPNLTPRAGVDFYSVHTDWLDWSPDWQKTSTYPNEDFLDLLSHARWLACRDHRDHIYAFLGHPLAQSDDGNETIVMPDYSKPASDVYLDLAMKLVQKQGLRTLSAVENNELMLDEDFPSWVPFHSDVEEVMCSFGIYTDFYYAATAGAVHYSPFVVGSHHLMVRGTIVDVVCVAHRFYASDLADPATLLPQTSPPLQQKALDAIWVTIQDAGTACAYTQEDRLTAFSLTLCAGLYTYNSAEDNLPQHCDNFAAYWKLRLQSTSKGELELPVELQERAERGDAEKFWLDMRLVCEGRSFIFTQKGYYGLGSCIVKPGDVCVVLFGANVPFLLRPIDGEQKRYKLVAEAFIHGFMRGEAMAMLRRKELQEEEFILC
jgi:hypothetical protein